MVDHSLEREENRLDQSIRQKRGLKQCIVDDFSDLCEGGGVGGRDDGDATQQRLKPVRSGVRENALWSLVMLCTHEAAASAAGAEHVAEALAELIETDVSTRALCQLLVIDGPYVDRLLVVTGERLRHRLRDGCAAPAGDAHACRGGDVPA